MRRRRCRNRRAIHDTYTRRRAPAETDRRSRHEISTGDCFPPPPPGVGPGVGPPLLRVGGGAVFFLNVPICSPRLPLLPNVGVALSAPAAATFLSPAWFLWMWLMIRKKNPAPADAV